MTQAIRRDYIWNSIGVFAQNAISPLLLIVVTRINGVYDSGIFSYALAVALIFWAFAIWGGRTYQVSDIKREFSDHSYVVARLLLGIVVLVGSVIFCVLNGYETTKIAVIISFVIFKIVESVSDAIYGVLQVGNRLFIAGISLCIKAVIGSVVFVIVDVMTKNLLLSALSLAIVNVAVFLFYDLYYARRLDYYASDIFQNMNTYTREAIVIIKRCAPIAAVIFLSMFSLNIPRYFLDRYHPDEIGYFGILVMPITVLTLVITFLLQPKIIHLSELFAQKKYTELNRTIGYILAIVAGVGALGFLLAYFIGIPVVNVIFNLDFTPYFIALLVIVLGAVANGVVSVYMNIFTIVRHFKALFYTLVVTNVLLLLLCIIIVNKYAMLGAVGLFAVMSCLQAGILVVAYFLVIRGYVERSVVTKKQ